MECPVCKDLRRDHSRECEIEASMILRSRAETGPAKRDTCWEFLDPLLATRKRQVQIMSLLDRHKLDQHLDQHEEAENLKQPLVSKAMA